jgi:predicted AAA+ superfamily ATPase
MIQRDLSQTLAMLLRRYPVVIVTGPRQSGKTTLCQACLPNLPYVNLDA